MNKLIIFFLIICSTQVFSQGSEEEVGIDIIGNGGNTLICFDMVKNQKVLKKNISSIQLYDFIQNPALEKKIRSIDETNWVAIYKVLLKTWVNSKTPQKKESVLNFLNTTLTLSTKWRLDQEQLPFIHDHDLELSRSRGCSRQLTGRRLLNNETGIMEIWIHPKIWNNPLFDEFQKAYLVFHEVVFYYLSFVEGESITANRVYEEAESIFLKN